MNWIDTHCHLNLGNYFPDPAATVREAREAGVARLVVIGIDVESSQRAVELASQFEEIYAVVGLHPTEVSGFETTWLEPIRSLAREPKVVAIGEIGLDYHWDKSSPEDQEKALIAQLDLAEELNLPVVYHCREAYDTLLGFLERRPVKVKQLMHCFVGNLEQAARAVALDAWFGVDGPVTFKNAHELREMVLTLPPDRVVIETDSPFLTPHPFRGKPNSPEKIPLIGEAMASLWDMPVEKVATITSKSAQEFFGILGPDLI
jgi:TatD DNase family protein